MKDIALSLEIIVEIFESLTFPLFWWNSGTNFFGISVLDFCGSLLVCYYYRNNIKSKKSWFEAFIACILLQFGGTTLTGILLGQVPSWIISNTAFPAFLLAFWLTFCCPFDVFWILAKYLNFLIKFGSAISTGHAVTSWGVDKALKNTFHLNAIKISKSMLTCILCGIFSGCGGGLISDYFGFYREHSFVPRTPSIFEINNYFASKAFTKSSLLSILYYVLVSSDYFPWRNPLLSMRAGHTVIVGIELIHLVLHELSNVDVFTTISIVLQRALSIPAMIPPVIESKQVR